MAPTVSWKIKMLASKTFFGANYKMVPIFCQYRFSLCYKKFGAKFFMELSIFNKQILHLYGVTTVRYQTISQKRRYQISHKMSLSKSEISNFKKNLLFFMLSTKNIVFQPNSPESAGLATRKRGFRRPYALTTNLAKASDANGVSLAKFLLCVAFCYFAYKN